MAYSATLANMRGLISDTEYKRILNLFSRAGLSMDHPQFDEDILDKGTQAILKVSDCIPGLVCHLNANARIQTRDGKLRAAIPSPLGSCVFINDVDMDEMFRALRKHKEVMKSFPRDGAGIEAFVDSSDTGYTINNKATESKATGPNKANKSVINDDANDDNLRKDSIADANKHASGPEGVEGLKNPVANGVNGHVNGAVTNGTNGVH